MSILIPVGYGEVCDKISILEIKCNRMTEKDALRNVEKELAILRACLDEAEVQRERITSIQEELRTVNERLWDIEDALREKESKGIFDQEFIELARTVYITNDRRSELKREINLTLGSEIIEEKSYESYL